jgi:hypothetical protein
VALDAEREGGAGGVPLVTSPAGLAGLRNHTEDLFSLGSVEKSA